MTTLDKVVSLAKRRGFIYPGSEIYGGLAGTWDYGPLGVELKNNIKKAFWQSVVHDRDDVVGLDAAILMNPGVWEASGHVKAFTDPLVECKKCHKRFRADQIEELKSAAKEEIIRRQPKTRVGSISLSDDSLHTILCIDGAFNHNFTQPRNFNLLVEAKLGVIEDQKTNVYLRGEITQGVHVNFKNVLDSTRVEVPFGIAQIGKAFRNEITPGNFTFRSLEFEQMELQFYIKPEKVESKKWYEYWRQERMKWYLSLGMNQKKLRFRQHQEGERAHYAKDAWDIEYESPLGWKEFEGIHDRGDWDLKQHQQYSGVDLSYYDQESGQHFLPWIIETSGGVDRAALFFLIDAYREDKDRIVLKLDPKLAPCKIAVFPLLANKANLVKRAREIYSLLKSQLALPIAWDDRGNIGKRYFAQDEIGTPYCITIDYQTLEDNTVTIRDRDTTKQERVKISKLSETILIKIA